MVNDMGPGTAVFLARRLFYTGLCGAPLSTWWGGYDGGYPLRGPWSPATAVPLHRPERRRVFVVGPVSGRRTSVRTLVTDSTLSLSRGVLCVTV